VALPFGGTLLPLPPLVAIGIPGHVKQTLKLSNALNSKELLTYKSKAPDGWHGYIIVWVNAWQWPANRDPYWPIHRWDKRRSAQKLGGLSGSVGYFVGVQYPLRSGGLGDTIQGH